MMTSNINNVVQQVAFVLLATSLAGLASLIPACPACQLPPAAAFF
jgi:ABC-type lipoprotein release transport system permease subunit